MDELKNLNMEDINPNEPIPNEANIDNSNITELNPEKITKSNKIIKYIKKTIVGVLSSALVFSLLPNVKYKLALHEAKSNKYINDVLNSDGTRYEKIKEIFSYAILNNDNISTEMKSKIIDAFCNNVIDYFGNNFTDQTIYNMYAVASTEKVRKTSSFAQKHGWWSGDYNSYFNTFTIETEDPTLIAHEQLHAILKSGPLGTGFTPAIEGYGLNEGATSYFVEDDNSYNMEQYNIDALGLVIGYDTVFNYYVNSDLNGLKKELMKYISKEETNTLINNINNITFSNYYLNFLFKNNLDFDSEKYILYQIAKQKENCAIIKKIFEQKYGCPLQDTNRGKLLEELLKMDDELFDENGYFLQCRTSYDGKDYITIDLTGSKIKKPEFIVNIPIEETQDKARVASEIGIDEALLKSYSSLNNLNVTTTISLNTICKRIKFDEIDDFNFGKFFEENTIKSKNNDNDKEEDAER